MPKVYRSSIIDAPVSAVWKYIRDFSGLHKWFPGVSDTKLEGNKGANQPGCVRNFGLPDGGRMREELLEFSDEDHLCAYRMIEGAVPMSRYQARVRLMPITDSNQTFAEMAADFDCAPGHEEMVSGFLSSTYDGAFAQIKRGVKK